MLRECNLCSRIQFCSYTRKYGSGVRYKSVLIRISYRVRFLAIIIVHHSQWYGYVGQINIELALVGHWEFWERNLIRIGTRQVNCTQNAYVVVYGTTWELINLTDYKTVFILILIQLVYPHSLQVTSRTLQHPPTVDHPIPDASLCLLRWWHGRIFCWQEYCVV